MIRNNFNESEVYKFWDIFKQNNQLVEIRLIASDGRTGSGYFSDPKTMIDAVRPYVEDYSVYFTINSLQKDCSGKPQRDKIVLRARNTTTDGEIIGRDWVLLDLDSRRVSGVNATDEQLGFAKKKANEVYKFIRDYGFNDPVVICSGSGVHLYLRCALKNSEENNALIKRFTQAMSMLFSDDKVDIDEKVFNCGRISRVPGYYNRKGNKVDKERPQRLCEFVRVPSEIKVNEREYFEKVAALYPEEEVRPSSQNNYSIESFDLDAFIEKHHIPVTKKVDVADGTRYYLEHCLFNDQHKGKDAILFKHKNGAVAYFCYHNSCSGNDWHKVREMYEPDAYAQKPFDPNYRREYRIKKEFKPIIQTQDKGDVWLKMSQIKRPKFDIGNYIPSGIQQIDDKLIGFKRKHVTVWSGYRGCAKSTLLNMLILNGANYGYKSALWTGELDADEEKTWLYLQAAGKSYNKGTKNGFYYTPESVCDRIDTWIDNYFWIFNNSYNNNFKQIIDKIRELRERQNIDFVILDNLMTLDIDDLDGDRNEKQKNMMYMLTCIAKELNIHVHIVAHPNKSGTFLRPNNISGTGHIPDLAQNVFILHRINRDFSVNAKDFLSQKTIHEIEDSRCTNTIEICKCRDKGSAVDTFVMLYFEKESNRLKNSIAENIAYGWQDNPTPPIVVQEEPQDINALPFQPFDRDAPF